MKDDYLWDGSGEPDPEIEDMERLLSRYRHKGEAPELPAQSKKEIFKPFFPRLAVAAAILLMLLAGLAFFLMSRNDVAHKDQGVAEKKEFKQTEKPPDNVRQPEPNKEANPGNSNIAIHQPSRPPVKRFGGKKKRQEKIDIEDASQDTIAYAGFLDVETARHIERAQMLLRSFGNIRDSEGDTGFDISYEKRRSRELLDKNVTLRRDAEMKGNLPVEELLVGLEPYLLDIANLPLVPAPEDVRAIKDRLEKREIVATLQVYSASALAVNK
ncbi:MAG: hypothetical protein L0229_00890 [Blastocatellia bacterium]|nr:hypothetical protein [Blastocatellia bacterium]